MTQDSTPRAGNQLVLLHMKQLLLLKTDGKVTDYEYTKQEPEVSEIMWPITSSMYHNHERWQREYIILAQRWAFAQTGSHKTKSMLFGTSQRLSSTKDPNNFEIKVCDDVVERVQVFKYLGVYIDTNLNWHTHVEIFSKKISSKIGILRRLKSFLTIYLSKTMFNASVLPHFTYCDIIWASSDETNISRLQKLQNTCARVIFNENRRSHVQPMLDSLSWMPIIDLIKYHTLVAVYKCA